MKSPFVLVGIVIIALIIGVFWSWPSYQAFLALRQEQNQKAQDVQTRTHYFNDLAALREKLQTFQTQLALLDWALPNDSSIPSLYGEIQSMAANSGLVLKSISSSVLPSSQSQLKTIEVSLDMSGSYIGLKEFIARAQSAPRVLNVESVGFSSVKESDKFNFEVRVLAYSY